MESYGILALLPAAIVIILALVTKKTHLSLCIGIFIGVIILCGGNPLTAFPVMFSDYIIPPLTSEGNIRTLIIIIVIQGMAKMLKLTGAGGLFGDHCSPISDTTIKASMASGCDHIAHVSTQIPYAFTAGAATFVAYLVIV